MAHLTVRLGPRDLQRIAALRKRGVEISSLVRDAIAREAGSASRVRKSGDVTKVLNKIYAKFPDPPGYPAPSLDLTDRGAVARAVRQRLNRRRPR
jgi:hypothetical protein